MLKITCFKCHWSWSLNRDSVQAALDSMGPDETYYSIECPKCRRVNKVTVKQLKRALPRRAAEDTAEQDE